jgi:two-component system NtrC family response regulator
LLKILIIDDDKELNNALSRVIRNKLGYQVASCYRLEDAFSQVKKTAYDIVFLDVRMPDGDGIQALPVFRDSPSRPEIIVLTGDPDEFGAEKAIELGAWDYLIKPFDIPQVIQPLDRAIAYRRERQKGPGRADMNVSGVIGSGFQMKKCIESLLLAAESNGNVLITGDTGTGKELFARIIHENSERAEKKFAVVDCTVLPESLAESLLFGHEKGAFTGAGAKKEGLVRQAHLGTLFLDEIGELPLSVQVKFLRFLEERRFRRIGGAEEIECDFRLIAATNRDLDFMVKNGLFRNDLLFRLKGAHIDIPPLTERKEDIEALARHYCKVLCEEAGVPEKEITDSFLSSLHSYSWPGNVRELIGALRHALNAAAGFPRFFPIHLPVKIRIENARRSIGEKQQKEKQPDAILREDQLPCWKDFRDENLLRIEKDYFLNLMAATGYDIKKAKKISGLSRSRLYGLLGRHQIKRH